jgi:surface antigen/cell division protein FtsB
VSLISGKAMKKQKNKIYNYKVVTRSVLAFSAAAFLVVSSGNVLAVSVDELRAQNSALQQQINDGRNKSNALKDQANTIENQISNINQQVSSIQGQITSTKTKINELQDNLVKTQAELDRQKILLKASIQALYKKGGASTVELLVGSDSFSQFMDGQTYLEKLKSGVQDSTQKVIALKQQITAQQEEQKAMLGQQQAQELQLQAAVNEQSYLLAKKNGEKTAQDAEVNNLKAQQAQVMASIAAQMSKSNSSYVSSGDGSNGGYPSRWHNAPLDAMVDSWGMYTRECVSYAAFKVAQSGRHMPYWGGVGNAYQWPGNARAAGIPVDRNPQPGDVAISTIGYYGHAMYVEAVNGRMVTISQYNFDWQGNYSEMTISADSSSLGALQFIHF